VVGLEEQALLDQVKPILDGMGFSLVELRLGRSKRQSYLSVVVYRPEGVGIDECAAISRNLLPRLELLDWLPDLRLEVSSPGLDRVLKSNEEFGIFRGRGLKVWKEGAEDWIDGINEGLSGAVLRLNRNGAVLEIPLAQIRKAKLDASPEAGA